MTEGPALRYYHSLEGRWLGELRLRVTDVRQLRMRSREVRLIGWLSSLGSVWMATTLKQTGGPEQRLRPAISLRGVSRLCMTSALSATDRGFSLHAATTASADDAAGREALCKWHASTRPATCTRTHTRVIRSALQRTAASIVHGPS